MTTPPVWLQADRVLVRVSFGFLNGAYEQSSRVSGAIVLTAAHVLTMQVPQHGGSRVWPNTWLPLTPTATCGARIGECWAPMSGYSNGLPPLIRWVSCRQSALPHAASMPMTYQHGVLWFFRCSNTDAAWHPPQLPWPISHLTACEEQRLHENLHRFAL